MEWRLITSQPAATTLSLDATFRTAAKATFVNDDRSRASLFNGGLHTAVNQKALIIAYRWCLTLLHSEIGEMLQGMRRRFELLNVDNPWAVIVDNCCHFRNTILDVYPDAVVLQDVWHVIMRYMVCILGGSKNPHQCQVGEDISSALIKTKAKDGIPARYWSKEEQEERLEEAFKKWVAVGGVWSAAAANTHRQQVDHVRKGCLARPCEDVATDGSRIEGSHKGWNALQRTHPSGIKVLTDLATDHVIRHNIRVDSTHASPYPFTKTTFGSHHVYLVNACAQRWNALLQPTGREQKRPPADLSVVPILEPANSSEAFGLVQANSDVAAYHTFVTLKDEPDDTLVDLSTEDPEYAERVAASLGVDLALLSRPLALGIQPSPRSLRAVSHPSTGLAPPDFGGEGSSSHLPHATTTTITAASALPTSESIPSLSTLPIDVDAIPDATEPSLLTARGSKKRQASTTLSRAQQEHLDSADPTVNVSDKRSRSFQPDAPSSSSSVPSVLNPPPIVSTPAPSSSSPTGQASSRASSILGHLPTFFSQCRLDQTPGPTAVSICLPAPAITGRTRSQRIISAVTGFDPRCLTFPKNDDTEFYLFMDLRAQYKWATYTMSATAWVEAASIYNAALESKKGQDAVRKTPRALMEKLEAVEATIHHRNKNKDYKSQSGSTDFWERHCNAVHLVQGKASKGKGKVTQQVLSARKPHTCHRCLSTMWAGGEGGRENHKRGYCSDGVKQKPTAVDGVTEELPPWPQPNGLFTKGDTFWPKRFAHAVRELYDNVVVSHEFGGIKMMEYMAFADMLRARLVVLPPTETQPSTVRFKLYRGLALGEQPERPSDLVIVDGVSYLHVSYLSEEGFHEVEALATA
ncbi:hypothetical protein LXA43DRAFT_973740 [Ganoderma leucocontextum]|nr:hypothetical protein LXA43DRAFT_973740 [Ganoderma leucocontextum]